MWLRLQEHSWAHCILTKTSCEVMSISCKRYPSLSIQAASPSIDKGSRFCSSFGRPDVPTMQGYIAGHPFVARHDPKTDPTSYKHVLMIIAIPACDLASWPGFNLTLASLCWFHYSQYNTIQYALTKKCTGPNQRQTAFTCRFNSDIETCRHTLTTTTVARKIWKNPNGPNPTIVTAGPTYHSVGANPALKASCLQEPHPQNRRAAERAKHSF